MKKQDLGPATPLVAPPLARPVPVRERLPATRESITRKFKLCRPKHKHGDLRVFAHVGLYPDGRPGELFLDADYEGSLTSGALDAVAMMVSIALQHGVPLKIMANKLINMRFEPMGATGDKDFPMVSSILDYVGRWLLARFGKKEGSDG